MDNIFFISTGTDKLASLVRERNMDTRITHPTVVPIGTTVKSLGKKRK
jgi:hypothetical protein